MFKEVLKVDVFQRWFIVPGGYYVVFNFGLIFWVIYFLGQVPYRSLIDFVGPSLGTCLASQRLLWSVGKLLDR